MATENLTKYARRRKEGRLKDWIDKSTSRPCQQSENPKVSGLERIEVLDTHVERQEINRPQGNTYTTRDLPNRPQILKHKIERSDHTKSELTSPRLAAGTQEQLQAANQQEKYDPAQVFPN